MRCGSVVVLRLKACWDISVWGTSSLRLGFGKENRSGEYSIG